MAKGSLSSGHAWLLKLHEAGLIPAECVRVVVDIPVNDIPKIYVEQLGVDRVLDVVLTLDGASIEFKEADNG